MAKCLQIELTRLSQSH